MKGPKIRKEPLRMATSTTTSRPNPERIFNTLVAFHETAALKTAIELDIFTAIADGANTSAALAAKIGAAERGVRILCDHLAIRGFLTKEAERYALAPDSAIFLNRHSPAYLGSIADFLTGPWSKKNFEALAEAVRKGGTASATGDNTKPNEELWINFARSMAPLTVPAAEFIAGLTGAAEGRPCKVLDIAAGHGMYGITMAKKNPNAQIVALDWPRVLEVAQENAKKLGVADHYTTKPGSAFETDLGSGYDFVLLTNIFHHFDVPACENLMRKVHAAMKPGGKAITLEFVPNEDRVTPPTAAAFSLVMLAGTDAGDAYAFAQYEKMFANAGFKKTSLHPVPEMPQQVLVSEK
jgi:2-polyprenyl-3-methyl-5-hydroxy-6-metoxy-1,4-benzoquinol methylase